MNDSTNEDKTELRIFFASVAAGVVVFILALYFAGVFATSDNTSQRFDIVTDKINNANYDSQLTLRNYNACKMGSNLSSCCGQLGYSYQEISRNEIAGTTTVAYRWQDGAKVVMLMFQNGKLVQRSQFGLR